MILRQSAEITKDQTAIDAYERSSNNFTSTIPTVSFLGGVFVSMMPGTVVIFGKVMITTKYMAATVAFEGEFIECFPAIVAPVHYA